MGHRVAEGTLGATLPALSVGTFEYRGLVFLRADHLAGWLDELCDPERDPPLCVGATAELVREIRDFVAEAGAVA